MTKRSQRESVYLAITQVFSNNDIDFTDGMNVSEILTKDMRSEVHGMVVSDFRTGSVEFEDTPSNAEKLASEAKLNSYVSGLISNWVRKDKRFNGNVQYVPKNPGSRAGQGDEMLKTLRALKKQFAGTPKESAVDVAIAERVETIAQERAKSTTLTNEQIKSLPADLIASLGIKFEG